ncbi:pancreatic secretory granule membrane major glycoprotein GP2-like isoform X2 [Astyanax mexicanus]|uniref:pancreatic secretory granule membrane major glycoprotein GP2-like isoform X1 n=1 Tax=Astyanax mexicanus TaxID=7994 RepID=UPI0020CB5C62|nr:pancreatic secretory granule membrane major glycoprotein GP2-like isoform X1 [Astyanax mexicanus]XP_049325691.1 pancreatic secretory granule membrane major glycoprotein GP2-like isoform X2 [Astyanax mexicanus]
MLFFIVIGWILLSVTGDPCYNYTTLNQPWRSITVTRLGICDNDFSWNGWYRLLHNGMTIRMPEICVNPYKCGTNITFWLSGPHPEISDGIITRQAIWGCCEYSVSIHVKACPGNYYVYEFINPNACTAAYCSGTQIHSKSLK